MKESDWKQSGGVFCPSCGSEVVRLIQNLCPQCHSTTLAEQDRNLERKSMKRYYQQAINKGEVTLAQARKGSGHK